MKSENRHSEPPTRQTSTKKGKKTKKKKKKRKAPSKAVPLVKGATAASLAKKRQTESSSTMSRSRRRKRSRENCSTETTNSKKSALFSSTAESLAVISKFHTLNKRLEQNERDETISEAERQTITRHIKTEQEAMGGLDRYQKASIYGAKSSKFVCADWVVPLLRKQKASAEKHLRILDVGAIDNQYQGHEDWLDAVPIDLHGGQHESVLQVDFFDYAHEYCSGTDLSVTNSSSLFSTTTTTRQLPRPFDAIVMSLVLNFQGDPRKRGDMLALAADPRLLKIQQGGMLFVAVPSASLENSRYCDLDRFVEVVTNPLFRFELVEQKKSSKLILLAFRRAEIGNFKKRCCYNASKKTFDYRDHEMKRLHPAKPGTKRNNFAVILKSSHNRT